MEFFINREYGRSRSGLGRVGGGNRFSGYVEFEMFIRYLSGDVKNLDGFGILGFGEGVCIGIINLGVLACRVFKVKRLDEMIKE